MAFDLVALFSGGIGVDVRPLLRANVAGPAFEETGSWVPPRPLFAVSRMRKLAQFEYRFHFREQVSAFATHGSEHSHRNLLLRSAVQWSGRCG
jgi:hypothetical protein